MKTLIAGLMALTTTAFAQVSNTPEPPTLKQVLKKPSPQVVIFRPTSLAPGQALNVTHMRVGDGSVRPGTALQLVVYSSEPDQTGNHPVLFQDLQFISKEGSPVRQFASYSPSSNQTLDRERTGIIAVLIGLLLPAQNVTKPASLPPQDIVSAEITDGTSIGLLLPAVQKVRSAAAR